MFDGAKLFGGIAALSIAAAVIAWPVAGPGGLIAVIFALYWLLSLYNKAERREIQDHSRQPGRSNGPKKKKKR